MKRTIKLTESELRNMISKSVKKILKEAIDYRSVSDWNDELSNTDNLDDYEERLGNAKENLRMQGINASLHHPATTPWASDDPDDLSSMDSVDLLHAKPNELERIANKRKTKVYPSGLEESIRRIVKESVNKILKEWDDEYDDDYDPSDMISQEKELMRTKPYVVHSSDNGQSNKTHFATREEAYKYFHSIINSSDPSMVAITVCVPTPKGIGGHLGFQEKVIERWLPNGKKPILGRYGAAH